MAYDQYGYNQGYPMGYGQPMPDQLSQLRAQQYPPQMSMQPQQYPARQQSGGGPIWVQGEAGAKSYMVAPGNSVILMDSEASVFYIKTADTSGMPMALRIFDYAERTGAQQSAPAAQNPTGDFVTRGEYRQLVQRIDKLTERYGEEAAADG